MRSSSTSLAAPSSPRVLRRAAMRAASLRAAALPATVCALVSLSSSAHAHFTLTDPPPWIVEGTSGDPQKQNPCGTATPTASGQGSATNVITTYEAGQKITVKWRETVYHPGHFRIALSANRADFLEPPVTPVSATDNTSVSAVIMDPVAPPVLMDGLFPRTGNNPLGNFSQEITLPDEPCDKCTLQVIQFMAEHRPGYYYHHCADIKIVPKGTLVASGAGGSGAGGAAGSASTGAAGASMGGRSGVAGSSSLPAGSGGSSNDDEDDGGCSVAPGAPARGASALASLMALGVGAELWRRRSARR